jgi:hypothetical protein
MPNFPLSSDTFRQMPYAQTVVSIWRQETECGPEAAELNWRKVIELVRNQYRQRKGRKGI